METQAGPISDVGKRHSNSYTSQKKLDSIRYWDQVLGNGIYVSTSIRGLLIRFNGLFHVIKSTTMLAGCHTYVAVI
jgi:hypothetical protein